MKICNVIVRENETDTFIVPQNPEERYIILPLGNLSDMVSTNAWDLFSDRNLILTHEASDLLNLGIVVYTSDQIISRTEFGFQGWSRHIKLYFPVASQILWDNVILKLEQMLSFLSGDRWELIFRTRSISGTNSVVQTHMYPITKVCLLSGGLDSLIGAIDLLEAGERVGFVSHYKRGSEGKVQDIVYDILVNKYGLNSFDKYKFYVQPKQENLMATKEETSRARSFLFLTLGICIANSGGSSVDLIVPENGLISLNVPLITTRLSSHSTRTTHPHYLSLFQEILIDLSIRNTIANPYRFRTKGEMMRACRNQRLLVTIYPGTLSCSHADISRFVPGSSSGIHCGYCVPCIIRQAAELAGGSIRTTFAHQIIRNPPNPGTGKGRDLRAFKMALLELQGMPRHSVVLRMLRSGPLPVNDQAELEQYLATYMNGMNEVRNFLQ